MIQYSSQISGGDFEQALSKLGLAPLHCYANILRPIITLFSADSKGNIMKTG